MQTYCITNTDENASTNIREFQGRQLANLGFRVFPCHEEPWSYQDRKTGKTIQRKAKEPYWNRDDLPDGMKSATTDLDQVGVWWGRWPKALVGINCRESGIFAVDIDVKAGINGMDSWNRMVEEFGGGINPEVGPAQQTPSGGYHLIFKYPTGADIPNNAGQLAPGIDLRSDGYICTGRGYTSMEGHSWDVALTDAPGWLLDRIATLSKRTQGENRPAGGNRPAGDSAQEVNQAVDYWLKKALSKAYPGNRDHTCYWMAQQLYWACVPQSMAEQAALHFASSVPGGGEPYTESEALRAVKSAYRSNTREPARLPRLNGAERRDRVPEPPGNFDESTPIAEWPTTEEFGQPANTPPVLLTEMGNAKRFAEMHAGRALYVKAWGWMVWDGKRWARDERGAVVQLAEEVVHKLYRDALELSGESGELAKILDKALEVGEDNEVEAAKAKYTLAEKRAKALYSFAIQSQAKSKIEAMLGLAQSEPAIAASPDEFDRDSWLLNVQNGIVNLKTGELIPHQPELKMTKLTGAAYFPDAKCPNWITFLTQIMAGKEKVIPFLQRAVGASLTSEMIQKVFFLYGTGANGKSTFLNAIEEMIGDYGRKIRAETIMVKRNDAVSEEIAQLAGKRFMLASELSDGQRLNEPLIKDLTGGDQVSARYLYHDSFVFRPVAKPWLYGNSHPAIAGTDNGIWRRVLKIPFTVTIPEEQQDAELPAKLRSEMDGILAWAVRGCAEWQKNGLQAPDIVTQATETYRKEQDVWQAFLDECMIESSLAEAPAGEVYTEYKRWAEESGLHVASKIRMSRALEEKGFSTRGPDGATRRNARGQAYYIGLGLRAQVTDK